MLINVVFMTKKIINDTKFTATIKTMGISVKLFEDSFRAFFIDPSGDNYKDMEDKRERMFKTCSVALVLTFPDDVTPDIAKALEVGKKAIAYQESQEKLTCL